MIWTSGLPPSPFLLVCAAANMLTERLAPSLPNILHDMFSYFPLSFSIIDILGICNGNEFMSQYGLCLPTRLG
jgi:hypothetical protein